MCDSEKRTDCQLSMRSDLKVHRDGRPGPFLLIVGRQQLDLGAYLRLLHPSHAFDPLHTIKLRMSFIGFSNMKLILNPSQEYMGAE